MARRGRHALRHRCGFRRSPLWLALLAAVAPAAAAAQPELALGEPIDWSAAGDPDPARYRVGPLLLTLRGQRDGGDADLVRPVLTVEQAGHSPVRLQGSWSAPGFDHRVTVGQWDADRLYVLFQSFTGGAHCCTVLQLVVPEGGRFRIVDLGAWDGDYLDEPPTDLDGDGLVDFVFRDNAFLYTFASYAESFPPPMIMNVVDGRLVDVSDRPAFRPIFLEAMTDAQGYCSPPAPDDPENWASNGACAGFVAAAARAGRFDEAWTRMLMAYDRYRDWPLPPGCRSEPAQGECLAADMIAFDDYPEALRHFLVRRGYIGR